MASQVLPLGTCKKLLEWPSNFFLVLAQGTFSCLSATLQVIASGSLLFFFFFCFQPRKIKCATEQGPKPGQCQSPRVGHKGPEHLLSSLQDPYLLLIFKTRGSQGLSTTPLSRSGRKRHQALSISHSSGNCLILNAK